MIKDHLSPHGIQKLIEAFCCKSFKKCIPFPAAPDSVDNFASLCIFVHHLFHCSDIILSVTINGNGDVAFIL